MKGFLSLSGITVIVGAMALILFSFIGNPLEDLRNQERLFTYSEIRENYSIEQQDTPMFTVNSRSSSALHESSPFYLASADSCLKPDH